MSQKKIQIFIDFISQPCRALVIFCDLLKIDYELVTYSLIQLDHKNKDFKNTNPVLTLPAMKDLSNNFSLGESHTIMRYLSQKYQNYTLYPNDLILRSKVDFYLDWHLGNTRAQFYAYTRGKFILPVFGIEPTQKMNLLNNDMKKTLHIIENQFLKDKLYINNSKSLTIADLTAYCELQQYFFMTDFQQKLKNSNEIYFQLSDYPNISNWMQMLSQIAEISRVDQIMIKMLSEFQKQLSNL